jgi:hypothetical protein
MGAPWLTAAIEAAAASMGRLDLLVPVTFEAWLESNNFDEPIAFASPVTLQARVQEGTFQVRTNDEDTVHARACIGLFELPPDTPTSGPARRNPIDPRDRFTLPSGYTGPIVDNVGAQHYLDAGSPGAAKLPTLVVWLR